METHDYDFRAFDLFLAKQGLAETTRTSYCNIARRMDIAQPIDWLQEQATRRPPPGTACTLRAATFHVLCFFHGMAPKDAKYQLPRVRSGGGKERMGLTSEQLDLYTVEVGKLADPARTLLLLLPLTGLRISEICALKHSDIIRAGSVLAFRVTGKQGKIADVVLGTRAHEVLNAYLEAQEATPDAWGDRPLFPSRRKTALTPAAVRKYTRNIAGGSDGQLRGLTPHVLRHTFCTRLVELGADLASVQSLARHKSPQTTMRYTKPSLERMKNAADLL